MCLTKWLKPNIWKASNHPHKLMQHQKCVFFSKQKKIPTKDNANNSTFNKLQHDEH